MEEKNIEEQFEKVFPQIEGDVENLPESTPVDEEVVTPVEGDTSIDKAVNGYVDEAKTNAEELQSLYTEQGAADALYKQVSSATNMMLDASAELTDRMIEEQAELVQKVIDEEKAKGELADQTAIAQAEQVLALSLIHI